MPYNYSMSFLNQYEETVKQLVTAFRTGELLQMETTDHQDLVNKQRLVNNLLSSLALNSPEYADIRKGMRTWTDYKEGIWWLYVGVPSGKMLGSKPKARKFLSGGGIGTVPTAAVYKHPTLLDSSDAVMKFVGVVIDFSPATRLALANTPEGAADEDGRAYLQQFFNETGWIVEIQDSSTFRVARQ